MKRFITVVLPFALAACGGAPAGPAAPSTGGCLNPDAGQFMCHYDLVTVEGKSLPYGELPRESHENQEIITGGRLSIDDAEGDGEGSYALRYEWTEVRPETTDLEHVMQDAGYFETATDGTVTFESLSDLSFQGIVGDTNATVENFPLSTSNVTQPMRLAFKAQ